MFRRLLIATLIGILAALAVAAFRHAMQLLEWIFLSNDTGSLVNAAEGAFALATADYASAWRPGRWSVAVGVAKNEPTAPPCAH